MLEITTYWTKIIEYLKKKFKTNGKVRGRKKYLQECHKKRFKKKSKMVNMKKSDVNSKKIFEENVSMKVNRGKRFRTLPENMKAKANNLTFNKTL